MKTIAELKQRIADITAEIQDEPKASKRNKLRKEVTIINDAIIYLELNPNESYVSREIEKLKNKIQQVKAGFKIDKENLTKSFISKLRKQYEDKHGMSKFKDQLRFLQTIA